jgi:hypothetical protein
MRDFLIIIGPVDLGLLAVAWLSHNPAVLIFGIGAIAVVTSTLTWIMFFVMDKY